MKVIKVIVRIDDVVGSELQEIAKWFLKNHPDVPCCIYAMKTHKEWNTKDWKLAKKLIEGYGWEIGGHTRNHLPLTLLSENEIYEEIAQNIQDIEGGLQSVGLSYKVQSFALPVGEYNDKVLKVLRELGIRFVLTYPDTYPYLSADNLQKDDKLLIIGVTHSGNPANLHLFNERFLKACNRGLYILGLHSNWWRVPISTIFAEFLHRQRSLYQSVYGFYRTISSKSDPHRLYVLYEHLNYIKKFKNIEFLTFNRLNIETYQ